MNMNFYLQGKERASEAIIFVGSYARGVHTEPSDRDLIMVFDSALIRRGKLKSTHPHETTKSLFFPIKTSI
jgi:predicted nucleotidyltransferase